MTRRHDSETVCEAWDDFILDVGQRLADELTRADRSSPRSRAWLVEAYREGYCGIELILRVTHLGSGEPTYFRAIFVRTGIQPDDIEGFVETDAYDADHGDEQFVVLIVDVETMDDVQRVSCWIPSLVRLERIEDFLQPLRNTGCDLDASSPIPVGGGCDVQDGEVRVSRRVSASGDDRLPGEMVERRAQVVDCIAKDRAQDRVQRGNPLDGKNVLRSIFVALSYNSISVRGHDCLGLFVKVVKVGVCPPDLDAHAGQIKHDYPSEA